MSRIETAGPTGCEPIAGANLGVGRVTATVETPSGHAQRTLLLPVPGDLLPERGPGRGGMAVWNPAGGPGEVRPRHGLGSGGGVRHCEAADAGGDGLLRRRGATPNRAASSWTGGGDPAFGSGDGSDNPALSSSRRRASSVA